MALKSMDDILSDEPMADRLPEGPESDSEPTEPAVKTESAKAPAVESKPAEKPAERAGDDDEDAAPEIPDDVEKLKRLVTAFHGDKRKHKKKAQELREELAKLQGQMSAMRQPPQAQAQQPKAPTEEEREAAYWKDPIGFVRQEREAMRQELVMQKLQTSEAYARRTHPDFSEKLAAFQKATAGHHAIAEFVRNHADPAEYVYQTGAKILLDQEMGSDPVAWREAEKAKIRAELEAERGNAPAPKPSPTKSIAGSRGSGAGVTQAWSGPRSLDDILA